MNTIKLDTTSAQAVEFTWPWQVNGHTPHCLGDCCDLPWQRIELEQHALTSKRAIFADTRTGKTRCAAKALTAFNPARAVVNAPKRACSMWADLLEALGLSVIRGYTQAVKDLGAMLKSKPTGVLVINEDKIWRKVLTSVTLTDRILQWNPLAYIRDESHGDADPYSHRSKSSQRIASAVSWYRPLTGTPTPNTYADLWAQCSPIDPTRWGSFREFDHRFLIREPVYNRVVAHTNVNELQTMLIRNGTFIRREDVFGPDSWENITRRLDLPPAARALYDKLAQDWILEAESTDGFEIMADHTLKRLTRLHELTCGYLTDELGTKHFVHSAKLDAVLADLSETIAMGEKDVIYHRYRWEGEQYTQHLREAFPKTPIFRIFGDTSEADAYDIWKRKFPATKGAAVAVVQTQSGGASISFAEASGVNFPSMGFSYATEYKQPRDRVYKPGCARRVTHYIIRGTCDEFIAESIRTKRDVHTAVMNADRRSMAFGRIRK